MAFDVSFIKLTQAKNIKRSNHILMDCTSGQGKTTKLDIKKLAILLNEK